MHVTIIKDDNHVYVDGIAHTVDCSDLPVDFHALQWDGERGEIEYRMVRCAHCDGRSKKSNEMISDFAPYQLYVDRWHVAKANDEEMHRSREAAANVAG